jgi:hypothetical protein
MYHAHPNYCNEVPWQDWANVSFGQNEQGVFRMVPSRILFFYIHHFVMTMETRVMKSELLCRHVITKKWVSIMQGSYVWKRHTCAAAGSYP